MTGIDKEMSEHIRAELELQFKKLAEAILAEDAARKVVRKVEESQNKNTSRFRLMRAAF
jgi:hypothetical protein